LIIDVEVEFFSIRFTTFLHTPLENLEAYVRVNLHILTQLYTWY